MLSLKERPCGNNKLLGVSTHNSLEAEHAENISADYISLSPINSTPSHTHISPLGWQAASDIISKSNLPVYLLGGMSKAMLDKALNIGAQGIAGIGQI
jgi:8-oxo-dGTP diphosphatase